MSTPRKTRKTCDKCQHYRETDRPKSPRFSMAGACALMGDINDGPNAVDACVGWDAESYSAGVYVGPKFGCIHWVKKEVAKTQ